MLVKGAAQMVKIGFYRSSCQGQSGENTGSAPAPEAEDGFASVPLQSAVSAEMKKGVGEDFCVSLKRAWLCL